ncbi:AGE family epimerase/isomerase [Blautia hominis]|uniref:AGE family epimerase/isomerase n=1 Tax=Blautia hominis TaxID=2025493 RepID=A0ABQ0BGY9_9FIRM
MFVRNHEKELRNCLHKIEQELFEEVIPFWEQRVRTDGGFGYTTCYDRKGGRTKDIRPGWFVGRTMYLFGALYNHIEDREEWFSLAEAGREAVNTKFCTAEGRFCRMMDAGGKVLEGPVSIFTDHFMVKGFYEYVLARKRRGQDWEREAEQAKLLTEILFENVKKQDILRQEGIPRGFQKHAVNFMTLLVALESRKLFGDTYRQVLDQCVYKSLYEFASDRYEKPFEYIRISGEPLTEGPGRVVDAGHTMESLWFSMKAGLEQEDKKILERAGTVLDWVIDSCYDQEFGGFYQNVDALCHTPQQEFQETDYAGNAVRWDDKIWWVQAEGLYTLAMGALYNENERHFQYFMREFEYVEKYFRDTQYGEWYSVLHRDNSMYMDAKGFELKGPYHVPRSLMNLYLLLKDCL